MTSVVDAIHVLRRGPTEWNALRSRMRSPSLTHVEVRDAALRAVDLSGIDFDGATFVNVDLSDADLSRSRLNGVRMSRVRLDGAILRRAELKGTDLDHVCLRRAILDEVETFELKIRRSDLSRATLRRPILRSCHVYNSDLTRLEFEAGTTDHVVFKRPVVGEGLQERLHRAGCDLVLTNQPTRSDWLDFDAARIPGQAARQAHVIRSGRVYWFTDNRSDFFVSHSSEDKESIARPLTTALRRRRQRVWFDEIDINAGDPLDLVIRRGIRGANFGVVIVSPSFFGREWTEKEVKSLAKKNVLVVRHNVTPDELQAWRPELARRLTISSDIGPSAVAQQLLRAVSRLPGRA